MSMYTVAIAETTFGLAHKRGLAVLVTCDYKGTSNELDACNTDADEMKAALEALDYEVHQLQNEQATKENVDLLLLRISKYLCRYKGSDVKDGQKKAIVFAFSGHGEKGDFICTHHPRECQDRPMLKLTDVVKPLLKSESENPNKVMHNIPKLFFIDACRGSKTTNKDGGELYERLKGNCRVDYATSPQYVANTGSEWMKKLARNLKNDGDSLQHLVSRVNREVCAGGKQHCWSYDCLSTGPLYLGKVTMLTRSYNTHPQYLFCLFITLLLLFRIW